MNIAHKFTSILLSFFLLPYCWAYSTLTLNIINKSNQVLNVTGIDNTKPGNEFKINKKTITPEETLIVTGKIREDHDLSGQLHFNSKSVFHILDPRKFHTKQAIFSISHDDPELMSTAPIRTPNPDDNPRALLFSEVTVTLKNKE